MPDFDIYRRYNGNLYHSRALTIEARDLNDLVAKLNAGGAGHFDVSEGDTLLVRRIPRDGESDAINTIQVNVPKPQYARA